MADYSFLMWAPLITAAVWSALVAYLVYQGRYRTWTELFFILLCWWTAAYGFADAIFFNVPARDNPTLAASASLACLMVGSAFLMLYGLSLHGRFHPAMFLAFVPVLFFIFTFPTLMFVGFEPLPGGPTPRVPLYDPNVFLLWLLTLASFWLVGLVQVGRTFLEVRRQSPKVARRIAGILIGLVATLLLGGLSNALLGLNNVTAQPPLFSALLSIPGVLIFLVVSPSAARRLNDAILRRKASLYDVKAVFLTFGDGTLIGSQVQPEENMIDADSFSATLDVISNFMRTSFPTLRGKWLKSIRHGDYTLVMERGRYVYLTLVLGGQENDQLRRKILEGLNVFEEKNEETLTQWRGMAKDARGVDELLSSMLAAT